MVPPFPPGNIVKTSMVPPSPAVNIWRFSDKLLGWGKNKIKLSHSLK